MIDNTFMVRRIVSILFIVCPVCIYAQSSAEIQSYITRYKQIALEQEQKYGIPASITLAQGILESRAGMSGLVRNANNHFGIKRGTGWTGPCFYAWDDDPHKSPFRVYSSAEESFRDHSRFLQNNSRYRSLFSKSVFDYRGWANGLQLATYATSPTYAKALIGYIETYKLYAINGGVKLPPGRKVTIPKTITIEELVECEDVREAKDKKYEEEKSVSTAIRRYGFVVDINDVRCTILYPGETLASISMKYNISQAKLLEYNETTNKDDLKEGDIVFIEKKKKKYNGAQDDYRVRKGDTLYQISQKFGIRLSCLSKMNNLTLFSVLSEGQKLRLK